VPGPVTNALSETPLALLRDGARLIRDASDLLADLGFEPGAIPPDGFASPDGLPPDQRRVLEVLVEPMLPDAVARAAQLSVSAAVTTLIHLELRGLIQGVGGRYRRAAGFHMPEPVAQQQVPEGSATEV